MKLYSAHSVAHELHGHKDVHILWHCPHREQPVIPYVEGIQGYEMADDYDRDAFNSLFTKRETDALREYLRTEYNDDTFTVEEVALPIERGGPTYHVPCGSHGDPGCMLLEHDVGYPLSIPVNGFYDVRDYELIEYSEPFLSVN